MTEEKKRPLRWAWQLKQLVDTIQRTPLGDKHDDFGGRIIEIDINRATAFAACEEIKRLQATVDKLAETEDEHAEAEETKREPKFKVGDVVKHKASGERAVVLALYVKCVNPEHRIGTQCLCDLAACIREFTGTYVAANTFGEKGNCDEEEIEDERTEQRFQNENAQ